VFGAGLAAKDRAVLGSPQVAASLLAGMREGLAAGPEGWVEDDLALVAPWGVELGGVRAPVALGMANRAGWCQQPTPAGWRTRFRAPSCGYLQTKGLCR